ncbi:phage tail protein, partial [Enterococcus faecalis]
AIGTVTPIQGKVTAVGEGTTEIVVTTEDGNFTAKCTLHVTTAD